MRVERLLLLVPVVLAAWGGRVQAQDSLATDALQPQGNQIPLSAEVADTAARLGLTPSFSLVGDSTTVRRKHHPLLGMAIGAAGGAAIGYTWAKLTCDEQSADGPGCEFGSRLNALWCGAIGLVAGGVIGSYLERHVPLPQARHVNFGAMPTEKRGMLLLLEIR